jgi:hypothetical protein
MRGGSAESRGADARFGNGKFMEQKDFPSPQREAAFFFGLFLRGHSADELRQDIDVPQEVLARWMKTRDDADPGFREAARRVYEFRKQVLAIFNFLVSSESINQQKM